ncbi:Phosphodiesterase/alkaline phosphatase D [Pseudonocardia sp. Ae168_Ps1]|uniref:alkaline phosphatase D family protein n=1 Tax=unclassified Pseudonocardia TaxID=2619320 RepID=UPI00094AB435|nr:MULTISPECIES: alkaline phosphatase D family protein [unclassified Pseudonocardia]OLL71477.1 Phosphodiesterase/alkaline phosphatase D [Pseudonocardia sp. Ae168_Ps1]OLL76975.1 Phosphodiesterase/alkaline phosphatase D [Pseudonocardia sp. Ae150A_Ps1]OLL88913.1 Phosphodiesterase/alkaline phosphatase D [Pseudonocardia sp. Ae263_Ps1]OLL91062.1 Phosphodiesterase/alkaline phosphatase D [Pseudonocardia sp. Ae356_Ps1]
MTLLLGPVLRHVDDTSALVWVQTDRRCRVEVLGCTADTVEVAGLHYAIVVVTGLEPDSRTPYEVRLDGETAWPQPGSPFPPSAIATRGPATARSQRVVFGSCRYVKLADPKQARHYGLDALDAYATRMTTRPHEEWPTALLLLGDQVYADELTPQSRRRIAGRGERRPEWPDDEIVSFEEYSGLYRDAWSDPEVRWMMSTIPTAMIFDDHDVRDDWNTSGTWRAQIAQKPWWRERVRAGLASYWVHQHLGNLSPAELEADTDWQAVRAADGDVWPLLAERADRWDAETGEGAARHKEERFSFCWELGHTRLIVIDSRNGRIVESTPRKMVSDAEFDWITDRALAPGPLDHLLLGTSVPWLLPQVISDLQAAVEKGGNRPGRIGRAAEFLRQEADLEHWPAFGHSFLRMAELIREACRPRGDRPAPATVSVLSGDVHHSYAAAADVHTDTPGDRPGRGRDGTRVHQLTCSPVHNIIPGFMRVLFRVTWSRAIARFSTSWTRGTGTGRAGVAWERTAGPLFGNLIATLELDGRRAAVRFERPRTASVLDTAAERVLTPETPTAHDHLRAVPAGS